MSKTNFSKVEGAFDDGLNKIKMQSIYARADELTSAESSVILERKKQLHNILVWMRYEVKIYQKKDKVFLTKAALDEQLPQVLAKAEDKLEENDWKLILGNYKKLDTYVKAQKNATLSDQEILNQQQRRNEKKRFNVSERWIPLK